MNVPILEISAYYHKTLEVAPSTKSRPPTLDEFLHRYGVNQDQLYKPCTRDIRVRVASLIKDWYKLGFCLLGFSRENWLKELKQDYVKNRLTHQRAEAVLDHWSEIEEEKATYNKLIKALMFCEERDIVQSVVKWISEMNISTRPGVYYTCTAAIVMYRRITDRSVKIRPGPNIRE